MQRLTFGVSKKYGLVYRDEQGHYADFHALRKTFITNLCRSGVSPKTAQLLARHSDINLTMNTYTMLGVLDQAAAVESLPAIPEVPEIPVVEKKRFAWVDRLLAKQKKRESA